ncbi:MAG TPA: hypothetical protein PKY89_16280 [Deltaproteobacteria bacterium]|nr:hypothetical protein [Deltaproteobacteria bacterium]
MMRVLIKYMMIAIVGLSLGLVSVPAFSADVTGKTSTQTLPTQSDTQTAPLPSNTQSVPLPSKIQTTIPSREYQQVDKPPVKTLDIPDYDLAGQLRGVEVKRHGDWTRIYYQLELMNKGTKTVGPRDIPVRARVINVLTNTIITEWSQLWFGPNLRNDYWSVEKWKRYIDYNKHSPGAPSTINDVKLIVDVDPNNNFGEDRRHRGNNRCVASW